MSGELQARLNAIHLDDADAASSLRDIVLAPSPNDADSIRVKEAGLSQLTELLVQRGAAAELARLLEDLRPLFGLLPKAKTAKIVRTLIDSIARVPGTEPLLLSVCQASIEWASSEKRTFLRQRLELRLASLYVESGEYPRAAPMVSRLVAEIRRLDDKAQLADVHLLDSKLQAGVRDGPRARAALTAARSAAASIYVPPATQADLDTQAGVLHAQEGDWATAASYFFEAYEALSGLGSPLTPKALKYWLLSKIMHGDVAEASAALAAASARAAGAVGRRARQAAAEDSDEEPVKPGRADVVVASGDAGAALDSEVEAMRAVAQACEGRSVASFRAALERFGRELRGDALVAQHLDALYDTLLAGNLARLVEPYSRVEVTHVAQLVDLPTAVVEAKLASMILDRILHGTLDQEAGILELWEKPEKDAVYENILDTLKKAGKAVDMLHARSAQLAAA